MEKNRQSSEQKNQSGYAAEKEGGDSAEKCYREMLMVRSRSDGGDVAEKEGRDGSRTSSRRRCSEEGGGVLSVVVNGRATEADER